MLSEKVQKAILDQINLEFSSSYTYLQMSAFCEHKEFSGCANWLRMQSQEENAHAMKLYDFMLMRNCPVKLQPIAAPDSGFESIPHVFETALRQEEHVSESINKLYKLAHEENAFAAMVELQWFITEQVEEEKTARRLVAQFNMIGDDPSAMLDLDRTLGERKPEDEDGE
jgi:ferritin